jgi:Flp pilus assembly protein TadD
MKADRRSCLRCGELLMPRRSDGGAGLQDGPTSAAALTGSTSQTPHLSRRTTIVVGTVASVVVVGLAGVLWYTSPEAVRDSPSTAVSAPSRAARPGASSHPGGAGGGAGAPAYEPAAFIAVARRGGASFGSGDFEAARAAYEQALLKRPDDPDTLTNLGQALVRLGRVDEGIARFERAVQLAPDAWAAHFDLAAAEGERGQWDRAVEQYREAVRVFPDDYATQFNLALALHKKGDEQAAITEYEKAIQRAPSEPSFHIALGVSLEKVGRIADAVREYRAFLEMDPSSSEAEKLKAHVDALTQVLPADR